MSTRTVLILGGTHEAATLAERLERIGGLQVITSLAGRTAVPPTVRGKRRIGGFGGIDGLVTYLREERIDLLLDATHPFATEISAHAAAAARRTGVDRLVLYRPAWTPSAGDRWTIVPTLEMARGAIPESACVFLAVGRQHLDAFAGRNDVRFVIRMVDPPVEPLPISVSRLLLGKPGTVAEETELLKSNAIDLLVCRNSGGRASYAKVEAARSLDIPVIMVERPTAPRGAVFATVDALVEAIV